MAETISSRIPEWLVERASPFEKSSTQQNLQVGFQLAQQWQQNQRMQRAQAMQEEMKRLALEEKERIAEGTVAISRILSKMGQTGGYTDPALQAEFWGEVSNHPKFASSPAFKDIMDTFQYAEQGKTRAELLNQTYGLRGDELDQKHLQRLDEIDARLENALSVEGLKDENREKLQGLLHQNRLERDRLKPTRPGEVFHDLPESEMVAMRSELTGLDNEYKSGRIRTTGGGIFSKDPKVTAEEQYRTRKQEIITKYEAKRISRPTAAAAPVAPTVTAPPAPPPAERQAGTIYQTPKGPYRWNGSGWEAP